MKCKRQGCTNLLKGAYAEASVFDERLARRNPSYTEPHTELWCLACYQEYEAHRYTYVLRMPVPGENVLKAKRVLRLDKSGKPVDLPKANISEVAPVEDSTPPWAKEEVEVLEAQPEPVRKKAGRPKKAAATAPVE